jgi:hypothetical protein
LQIWKTEIEKQEPRRQYQTYFKMLETTSDAGEEMSREEVKEVMRQDGVDPNVLDYPWAVESDDVSNCAANRVSFIFTF